VSTAVDLQSTVVTGDIESLPAESVTTNSATSVSFTAKVDADDSFCIPDTQINHVPCQPSAAVSPDAEIIPDTPDSRSGSGVRRTFQRSYLASTSNLLHLPRKNSSPPRRRMTQLRKCGRSSMKCLEECDSIQTSISPNILDPASATHLPYPPCDAAKRCATDPLPLSKRSDHKITPTKVTPSSNSSVVYGTVPAKLFQEALNREKYQLHPNPRTKKEKSKLVEETGKLSDLDDDPMLSEVLGELKVDSERHAGQEKVFVGQNNNESCHVSHFSDKTVDKSPRMPSTDDDDLDDILGELRQQNHISRSAEHPTNNARKNRSSPTLNDARETPSSLCNAVPECMNNNNNSMLPGQHAHHQKSADFKPTDSGLEEQTKINSAENLVEGHLQSSCPNFDGFDGKLLHGMSRSHDDAVDGGMSSQTRQQNSRCVLLHCF